MNSPLTLPPLSLYIHIPWCVRKCPYCDFNSHAKPEALPVNDYVNALLDDLKEDCHWSQDRSIKSIFFGGGTPSLFPPEAIGRILEGVNKLVPIESQAEITLETNPGTTEYFDFSDLRSTGVNRLSFGAQSFDNDKLNALGRIHSSDEITIAVERAKNAGFANFNIDLMHGLPGQDSSGAVNDLKRAIALEPTHISWYQLTIEPNTAFHNAPPTLPSEDILNDTYFSGIALLQQHGYEQYEVSAFSQAKRESQHNLNYWQFGDYLAIGAGAHGKVSQPEMGSYLRYNKTRMPSDYLNREKAFTSRCYTVDKDERALEFFMNALRLKHGVVSESFSQRTGLNFDQLKDTLASLKQDQLLLDDQHRLCTSETGFNYLNEVLERFS